ncbi:MAG: hypothetical protein AB2L24_30560 [Mangrovibacterium sp.]
MNFKRAVVIGCLLVSFGTFARNIYVDPLKGSDDISGDEKNPYKTIKKAMSLVAPGDTIHLFPVVYHESFEFYGKRSGTPDKPIVVDGHGATLDGAMPIDVDSWIKVGEGLYKNTDLPKIKRFEFDIIRWAFFFDGIINRMDRTSKGFRAPFKQVSELKYNEWTYNENEKAFYLQVDPSKELSDYDIKAPMLANGVGFSGCSYIVIKNITSTGVINDGFNIHGDCAGLYFENITSTHCGDDGFSAHENAVVKVKGFMSIDNSTGVCSINNSCSEMTDVLIKDCVGHDVFFPEGGVNTIRNCVIISSAQNVITVGAKPEANFFSTLIFDNLLVIRKDKPGEIRISKGGTLKIDKASLSGLDIVNDGSAIITNSVIGGPFKQVLKVRNTEEWKADGNLYGIDLIEVNDLKLTQADFGKYQSLTGQDTESIWEAGSVNPGKPHKKTGADFKFLRMR